MDSFVIAGCTNSRAGKGSSNGILGLLVKDFGLGWGEVQFEAVRNRIWDADSRRRGRMKPSYDVFVLHPGISFRWELEWGGACNGNSGRKRKCGELEGKVRATRNMMVVGWRSKEVAEGWSHCMIGSARQHC